MKRQSMIQSFQHAFEGIITCIRQERNIRIHLTMMVLVIICGIIFHLTMLEWMICILLFGLVISLEIINTAIEAIVDLCSPDYHPLAKIAKDCGAGAVLVSAIAAAIIGLMIFIPHLLAVL